MARCCSCALDPVAPNCRQNITAADLATLLYVQGLDVNLCTKFQQVASLLQLRDCAGNVIAANAQVVLCSEFATQLCDALADLASGGSLILNDTLVVGADCQTYTVPETPITVTDSTCINLTTSGPFNHNITAALIISPDAGNQATCLPNGLYVSPATDICDELDGLAYNGVAVPGVTKIVGQDCNVYDLPAGAASVVIQTADTSCLDLNVIQAPAGTWTISGTPVISPNADNAISCLGNGLFVADVSIVGQDTACIDIEIVEGPGNNDFVITVDPIISGAVGNILQCTPQGLYVPAAAATDVSITALDTPCFDMTVTEATPNNFVISGSPIISPVVGNALACSELGLFVLPGGESDPVTITGIDTNCITITVDNPAANQWELTVTPVVSADPDNVLQCTVDGLFVPSGVPLSLIAQDTACIDMNITPTGPNSAIILAEPIIADTYPGFPGGCNSLLCTVDGLATPPDHTGLNFELGDIGPFGGTIVEGGLRILDTVIVNITNPSDCRYMAFTINTRIPEVSEQQFPFPTANQKLVSHVRIDHEFNFPTAFPAPIVTGTLLKTEWWQNTDPPDAGDTAQQRFANSNPGGSIANLVILPPGGSGQYIVNGVIIQEKGTPLAVTNSGLIVRVQGATI